MTELLYYKIVCAAFEGNDSLDALHKEVDLLKAENRKGVRRAFEYLEEVQDPKLRNRIFCFLWEKSGHPWDIPVTMTTIRG